MLLYIKKGMSSLICFKLHRNSTNSLLIATYTHLYTQQLQNFENYDIIKWWNLSCRETAWIMKWLISCGYGWEYRDPSPHRDLTYYNYDRLSVTIWFPLQSRSNCDHWMTDLIMITVSLVWWLVNMNCSFYVLLPAFDYSMSVWSVWTLLYLWTDENTS